MLRKILLGAGIVATVFSVLIFSGKISVGGKDTSAKGTVVLWGTLPETGMNSVVQQFNPKAKDYSVQYVYVPEAQFHQKLLEALANGNGPDLIIGRYQSILAERDRILPFPLANLPEKNFNDTYLDGAKALFGPEGAIGLPISIEPMVLFYNRSLLSKHGIVNPPAYWDEVASIAPQLTVKEGNRFIETGIALGTPGVPYQKDIMMAIVEQLGQSPVVRTITNAGTFYMIEANSPTQEGSEVLPLATVARFVSQFGDPGQRNYTWSESFGDPTDAFVSERLAMLVGYSGDLNSLRERNPRASFEMTVLPQTKGYNTFATGMRMYAIATLKASKNPVAGLTVESQFAGAGVAPTLASLVGGVPAFRASAGTQGLDPVVARSMLVAKGWLDFYEKESTGYADQMISDIINYRYGVNDAVGVFIGRLRDLYSTSK
jgi:ABC-type glycerol-3-phosphate transport system substrate-binding protein